MYLIPSVYTVPFSGQPHKSPLSCPPLPPLGHRGKAPNATEVSACIDATVHFKSLLSEHLVRWLTSLGIMATVCVFISINGIWHWRIAFHDYQTGGEKFTILYLYTESVQSTIPLSLPNCASSSRDFACRLRIVFLMPPQSLFGPFPLSI